MPTQIQLRRGTTAEHSSFTGAAGEVTVDTTKKTLVVHDGSTAGGIPVAKENNATLTGSVALPGTSVFNSTGLGIGTSSPATKLQVYGTATATQISIDGTGRYKYFEAYASGTRRFLSGWDETSLAANIQTDGAHPIAFNTNSIERMRLDSSGNLGIGTSSPATKLDVNSSAAAVMRLTRNGGTATNTALQYFNGTNSWYAGMSASGLYSIGYNDAALDSGQLRLDSSGNLGLGVTPSTWESTSKAFQFGSLGYVARGSSGQTMLGYNNYLNASNQYIYIAASQASRYEQISGEHRWFNAASGAANTAITFTQAMTLDASGNLLVQATSSSVTSGVGHKIRPDAAAPFMGTVGSSTSGADVTYSLYSTGAAAYRFYVGYNGTISATTTTISGISDVRLKENIRDLDDGLAAVMALKPRKFDWKAGKGKDIKDDRGFIAQEFEQVFPDMIDEWKDPAPEGEEPYKAVNANLIPTLVKAIQELKAEVDSLKAQLKGA